MASVHTLLAFAATSLLLILIPGPSVLFVVGRSLAWGRRAGVLSVLGNGLGAIPAVVAVSLGLGAVVAESVVLFTVIKVAGAAYLIHLGIQAIRHRSEIEDPVAQAVGGPLAPSTIVRQGFVVGLTNPKTAVFFIAVLPQFVDVSQGHVSAQMMVLGAIFVSIGLVFDSVWAIAAGTARDWFVSSPQRLEGVRATGGAMMIGLGGVLVFSGKSHP